MKKFIRYFKESHHELKKVVWPGRDEVIASTKVVMLSTLVIALILGLIDFLIVQGVNLLF